MTIEQYENNENRQKIKFRKVKNLEQNKTHCSSAKWQQEAETEKQISNLI